GDRISLAFLAARRAEERRIVYRDSVARAEHDAIMAQIIELCEQGRELAPDQEARFGTIASLTRTYAAMFASDSLSRPLLAERAALIQQQISIQADSLTTIGRSRLSEHQSQAQRLARRGERNVVTALLLAVIVLAWLMTTLPRRAVTPIRQITNAIRRTQEGGLEVRVSAGSQDELAELGRQFNRAMDRLQEFDRQKQDRIQYLERRFRILCANIAEGVLVFDRSPRIVFANAAVEPLLGCSAADALGRPLGEFPLLAGLVEPLEKALSGAVGREECEVLPALPFSAVCISTLKGREGNVFAALVVITNPVPPPSVSEEGAETTSPS
ncbi:MAG: HAMP domain-containing protein, partial [candidate division WOR-3 bacterium]